MPDGKFFNWLLSNVLPKVIEKVLITIGRNYVFLKNVGFFSCSDLLTKSYCPRSNAFISVIDKET